MGKTFQEKNLIPNMFSKECTWTLSMTKKLVSVNLGKNGEKLFPKSMYTLKFFLRKKLCWSKNSENYFKFMFGLLKKGDIDVCAGCWRQNVLLTSLRC